MKKACILTASPRKNSNTLSLVYPFVKELEAQEFSCRIVDLYDKDLKPCIACLGCQTMLNGFGCSQKDDMDEIFTSILACDLIILASPIYSWYCTPPMKIVLDRLVYGMNKYYGSSLDDVNAGNGTLKATPSKPNAKTSLWEGKYVALITTCGYPPEKGSDLFEEGMKRYCRHSKLTYIGMLAEQHIGYGTVFMDDEKERHAKKFAQNVALACR